ncbi:MAG TPA: TIGR03013 family PEP-CTERM/XrtA system glycosyltransferase [Gammaproteobacteria bacterium]|nr:TIGR03013 family PEP-CTERM/XrtA system glycosyltransferase [Gammaproteobacteria bacterium]
MIKLFGHFVPRSFFVLGLVEFCILLGAVYVGVWIRFQQFPAAWDDVASLWPQAVVFALGFQLTMVGMGLYQRNLREGLGGMALRITLSGIVAVAVLSLLFFVFPDLLLGRGVFGAAFVAGLVGVVITRLVFFHVIDQETLKRRVLVLGAGRRAAHISERLRRRSDWRDCRLVGYVHIPGEHDEVAPELVIRRDTTLVELAQALKVDEIVVAVQDRRKGFPLHEILDCRMAGIDVVDILTFFERQTGRVMLDLMQPSWLIFSDGFRYGALRVVTKRAFDVGISLLLLAVVWPLMLLAAAAILIESKGKGPVFYGQVRVGENWRLFQVLKFRSMQVDAEADGKARFASKRDPRITRVGGFMRRTRIDELPQLFNVLKGDMSFVGPRPERPVFVEKLAAGIPFYAERHRVKPGITGWAQICFPYADSEEGTAQKLQYDLYYVKNYSLFLDLLILLHTAEVVLWGRGAR